MSSDWFYHAPHKRQTMVGEPPAMPPMSQIPGLSDLPAVGEEEPRGVMIRDTDSKYIRLAKAGGRKNLLYFKQGVPSDEPQKYPVPEWWGNKFTDGPPPGDIQPRRQKPAIPDYMVHQSYYMGPQDQPGEGEPAVTRARIPFGQDGQSHWSRDANNVRQPTHNIIIQKQKKFLAPIESRKHRDVASEKAAGFNVKSRSQSAKERSPQEVPAAFVPELPVRMKTFISTRETHPACLGKILNYGYQREWLDEREQQRRVDEEKRRLYSHNLKAAISNRQSAQAESINVLQHQEAQPSAAPPASGNQKQAFRSKSKYTPSVKSVTSQSAKPWKATSKTAHHSEVGSTTGDLYKMKRFENVPSRVNTLQEVH